MSKSFLLFTVLFFAKLSVSAQSGDPVALTINGNPVYKSEIESAYSKYDGNQEGEKKQSFDDFLRSYIDFRLNVEEAKAQQLDTTATYKREYYSYKAELGRSYLRDTVVEEGLLKKYYQRMLQDVKVNHVLIPYAQKEKVLPSDTLALYNEALSLRQKLSTSGFKGEGFINNELNPSLVLDLASVDGQLGWVTAAMLPLQIEDAIYSLSEGEVSSPIRTQRGYHLVQVMGKRPAIGAVRIDQVLFNFPTIPPTSAAIDSVGALVYKIYDDMKDVSDYQILCDRYAEAYRTGEKKCDFGIVKLDSQNSPSFINAALNLRNVGDVSEPVMTDYGYHILRLTAKLPIPEYTQMKTALKALVFSGDRGIDYQSRIKQNLESQFGIEIKSGSLSDLQNIAAKIDIDDPEYLLLVPNKERILFVIGGRDSYTINDFLSFVKLKAASVKDDPNELPVTMKQDEIYFNLSTDKLNSYLTIFSINKLYDYAEETLEERYPEFAALMKVYSEGILLFDVKNLNVWNKAKTDEAGLANYFEKNKAKYKWDKPRYKGVVFYCNNESVKHDAEAMYVQNGQNEAALSLVRSAFSLNEKRIIIESQIWNEGDNVYVDNKAFGQNKAITTPSDHRFPYVAVIGRFIPQPEDFRDVRAAVEEDYQKELDIQWNSFLRNKYKVEQNKPVLKSIKRNK